MVEFRTDGTGLKGLPLGLLGKYIFFACICLTFVAMGFFSYVYKPLAIAAVLGTAYFLMAWQQAGRPAIPYAVLLPFAFMVYVAIFPGWPLFPDIQIADIGLEMYLVGLGFSVFFTNRAYIPPLCLAACICVTFIYWIFASPPSFTFGGYRLQLLFNHPNVLGLIASWNIVHICCVWRQLPRGMRPFAAIAIVCLFSCIVLTEGRSTYLSILLTIVGSCFIMPWKIFRKVLLAGILCWFCAYALSLSSGHARMMPNPKQLMQEQNMQTRIVFWKAALDGFYTAPLTGLGHRTYGDYLDRYITANAPVVEERPRHPHSMYLDILYSWGLVGAVMLFVVFVPAMLHARRQKEYFLPLSVLLMLGHGVFDSSLHMKAGLMVIFIPLGMLWGKQLQIALIASPLVRSPSQTEKTT